jgi:alpha-glucoside transport system permease protein
MLESVYLEGASPIIAFLRLLLPHPMPALASLAIFQFMWVWNDLLIALIFLGGYPDVTLMTVTISKLVNSLGSGWQLLTVASFMPMMLSLVFFFTLQRYLVYGIVAGQ